MLIALLTNKTVLRLHGTPGASLRSRSETDILRSSVFVRGGGHAANRVIAVVAAFSYAVQPCDNSTPAVKSPIVIDK